MTYDHHIADAPLAAQPIKIDHTPTHSLALLYSKAAHRLRLKLNAAALAGTLMTGLMTGLTTGLMAGMTVSLMAAPPALAAEDAAPANVLKLEDYLDFEGTDNPQISPDGSEIVYTRTYIDKKNDRRASALWVMNSDGSKNRMLVEGGGALWSPDGARIAYVAKGDDDKPQIFVRWMDDEGGTTQITRGDLQARSMAWSPDGKWLAFVARIPRKNDWSVSLPGRPQGAKWESDPNIIENYHYRQDRVGTYQDTNDHLFVVPAEGGTARQLTSGDWNVGARAIGAIATGPSLNWSPDGKTILIDGNAEENWKDAFFSAHIYTVDVASGAVTKLTDGNGFWSSAVYSPDGKKIAYSGVPAWDKSYPLPLLYVMDADGKNAKAVVTDMADGPNTITWAANGRSLYYSMGTEGHINTYNAALSGKVSQITKGAHVLSFSNVSKGGVAVGTLSSPLNPTDVVRFDIKDGSKLTELTDVNAEILAGKDLGSVEEIWYTSTEGTRVQGWIVKPPAFDESKKYPLYLMIHGGPHAMYNTAFNFSRMEHAANGYVVLFTNPRGSTGYGSDFANAIENQYPGDRDFADLMAGVDATIAKGYIDTDKLYVEGCSGGGVLTTWAVSHTDRFAAAVARCPVVNWISMANTTDVAGWATNFFKPIFWEDPTRWLDHSPIMHVHKVKTPTLLMTGDKDLRTPLAQAEEFYGALKHLGVPTKLIPMRGEYHGTGSIPSNYLRTQLYIRKWFEDNTPKKDSE